MKPDDKITIAQELDAINKELNAVNDKETEQELPAEQDLLIVQKKIVPESRRDMRGLAFHFLYAVDRFDYTVPLEKIIENFKTGFNLELAQDSPAEIMAQGAITQREELDEQIKPLLRNWRLERLGCCTRLILRLALWELKQPDAIPNIVINEAIELAKGFAEKDAYKFINGILDEACKVLFPGEKITEETIETKEEAIEAKEENDEPADTTRKSENEN